jgi:hypothetical protein
MKCYPNRDVTLEIRTTKTVAPSDIFIRQSQIANGVLLLKVLGKRPRKRWLLQWFAVTASTPLQLLLTPSLTSL